MLDWEERIKASLPELKDKIDIRTYAFAARHYTDTTPDYYNYLIVDEAHHAVAPVLKRVVQYYRTAFTIGLTATDQRPDKRKTGNGVWIVYDFVILKRSDGKGSGRESECLPD